MRLAVKIFIFGIVFLGTVLLFNKYLIQGNLPILAIVFHGWLCCVYIVLLYLEIRSRLREGATQKQIRWAGFHFTFWAGFFWGMLFSSRSMDSWFIHPVDFFSFLFGFIGAGIIFGIVGMAITQFMVLFIFKHPEQI
jgi:hypothetical protein